MSMTEYKFSGGFWQYSLNIGYLYQALITKRHRILFRIHSQT